MKGFLEEYGSLFLTVFLGLSIISFAFYSTSSETGAIHKLAVKAIENMGARSKTNIKEWDIGSIKATLKDDGILYLTGSGTLPAYDNVGETPWAEQAGWIDHVVVENGVIVTGEIPIG